MPRFGRSFPIPHRRTKAVVSPAPLTSNTTQDVRGAGTSTSSLATDVRATGALASSQTLDARLVGDRAYTRDNLASLPTTNTALATAYSAADVANVSSVDSVFVDMTGSATYLLHQFGTYNANTQAVTLSWTGKSTKAASTATVSLQIYNVSTPAWETLATNTTATAGASFTLSAQQSANIANYYDASKTVWARVVQ